MRYLAVAFFIIFFSLNLVIVDFNFYENKGNCEDLCGNVIKYFFYFGELEGDYSEQELIHMEDVRNLVIGSFAIMLVLLSFMVFVTKRDFLIGGVISSGVIFLLLIFLLLDFSFAFEIFHKVFFRNDFWLLPDDSLLITMSPESFFYMAGVRIVLYTSLFSGLSIIGGLLKWQK